MTDFIIIVIIAIIIVVAAGSAFKHLKGKRGCCGSGDYKPKRKKLSGVLYKKTFKIDGMHCDHCKARVEEIINDMSGLAGEVDLKKGELTVSYAEAADDELIKSRIEKSGYIVTAIIE
ncbi:MAG: heavy-metal-associated domain-containing protein [Clostridia bacterium]|nr:heavy-metal-associated domain-containing protein [Clostridia bacterium]